MHAHTHTQEGRKIWEQILSISRNLSRMVTLYRREVGNDKLTRIKNLIAAYPYLLRHHVRSGCLCNDDSSVDERYRLVLQEPSTRIVDTRYEGDKSSGGVYRPETLVTRPPRQCWVDRRDLPWCLLEPGATLLKVARSQNRPLWVCDRLGKEIMSIPYGPNYTSRERLKLLDHVDKLTNAIGQCERIHQTAVPLNYARHALRSLTLWLFTLPFALVKDLGLLTAPIVGVIAWLLFGVYQIGHSIEDPFQGSLRLSILCDAIRRDVLGTVLSRQSAFGLEDTWEEDDDDDDDEEDTDHTNKTSLEDILPTQAQRNMQDVVSHAPKLVKQNGSWKLIRSQDL